MNLVDVSGVFHHGKKQTTKTRTMHAGCQCLFSAKSPPSLRLDCFQSRRECREWISLLNFASPRTRVPGREATKTQTKAPWRICGIAIFPRPVGQTHEPVGGFTLSSFGAVLIKGSMVPRFESKRHYLLCERAVRSTIPIRVARCTSVIPSVGPQPMLAFLRSSLLPRT